MNIDEEKRSTLLEEFRTSTPASASKYPLENTFMNCVMQINAHKQMIDLHRDLLEQKTRSGENAPTQEIVKGVTQRMLKRDMGDRADSVDDETFKAASRYVELVVIKGIDQAIFKKTEAMMCLGLDEFFDGINKHVGWLFAPPEDVFMLAASIKPGDFKEDEQDQTGLVMSDFLASKKAGAIYQPLFPVAAEKLGEYVENTVRGYIEILIEERDQFVAIRGEHLGLEAASVSPERTLPDSSVGQRIKELFLGDVPTAYRVYHDIKAVLRREDEEIDNDELTEYMDVAADRMIGYIVSVNAHDTVVDLAGKNKNFLSMSPPEGGTVH